MPASAALLQDFLEKMNPTGATRMDLLKLAGSSTNLDSWLYDLIYIYGLAEKRGDVYAKTSTGRRWEQDFIKEYDFARAMSTRFSGPKRVPRD